MVMKKETVKEKADATDLWKQTIKSIPIKQYVNESANTEKILLFSESGGGKTTFYLGILRYFRKQKVPTENLKMCIVYPDRPSGLTKLFSLIPKEYQDCIEIFPVSNYEDTIIATNSAVKILEEHYKQTGYYGWLVFELMENYWTFSMDYYCRKAYGETMADYFTEMQAIMNKDKADKTAAFAAFAGPMGGPWPAIKFHHNFNWIDKLKRMPYNMVFTSEVKQEDNKDSIFYDLGFRPAGEKHTQHRVDTVLYLSHKGNQFNMRAYKLTGYTRLYSTIDITSPKNGKEVIAYEVHKKALKRLEDSGYRVSKIEDIEMQAGIKPPKEESPKKEKTDETKKSESSNENADAKEESTEDEEVFKI